MSSKEMKDAQITKEQYAAEEQLLKGVPRVNLAALLIPPIWGPAHGIWMTIIFYPLWLVADTCFVNAVAYQTPLAIALAILVFLILLAGTIAFAVVSQPFALHRALEMGTSKQTYLRRQRIWALVGLAIGAAALAAATYYNLFTNPTLQGVLR